MNDSEIEQRLDAIRCQIKSLLVLNLRFGASYTNLLEAVQYGRHRTQNEESRLSEEEFRQYEEINRRANHAKHHCLGVGGLPEVSSKGGSHKERPGRSLRERLVGVMNMETSGIQQNWDEQLGNCKGDLETALSKHIGRPLKKNEPRYRYLPMRHTRGLHTAIVCLDMLRDEETNDIVQLIGDPYAKKKDAQHSAALQGLSYVLQLGPGGGGDIEPGGANTKAVSREKEPKKSEITVTACQHPNARDVPSNASIVDALRRVSPQPLKLRELYLTALGRNPKTDKMGSGVKKPFNRRLCALKTNGIIKDVGASMWTLA